VHAIANRANAAVVTAITELARHGRRRLIRRLLIEISDINFLTPQIAPTKRAQKNPTSRSGNDRTHALSAKRNDVGSQRQVSWLLATSDLSGLPDLKPDQ